MDEPLEARFDTMREGRSIAGRIVKIENGNVFVSLLAPFQYFAAWDPLEGEEPIERGRVVFEQLADTWAWILRTPEILGDHAGLLSELASIPWLVSAEELARRLGCCFGSEGELLLPEPLWTEIQLAWGRVLDVSDGYARDRVYALAKTRNCPHPHRLWQVWDELDLAPRPLSEAED